MSIITPVNVGGNVVARPPKITLENGPINAPSSAIQHPLALTIIGDQKIGRVFFIEKLISFYPTKSTMAAVNSALATMRALQAAGSPTVLYEQLPSELQRRAQNLYQNGKWVCCGKSTFAHMACSVLSTILPTPFEELSSYDQYQLMIKYLKLASEGSITWQCCGSSAPKHNDLTARQCRYIHNQSLIPTSTLIYKHHEHPLLEQTRALLDSYSTLQNTLIISAVRSQLQQILNHQPKRPANVLVNRTPHAVMIGANGNHQLEETLSSTLSLKASGTSFAELPLEAQRIMMETYSRGRWYCCGITGWDHPGTCQYMSPLSPDVLDRLLPKIPFSTLSPDRQKQLVCQYFHKRKSKGYRWTCCGSRSTMHIGELADDCRRICGVQPFVVYELMYPDSPVVKSCKELYMACHDEDNRHIVITTLNYICRTYYPTN